MSHSSIVSHHSSYDDDYANFAILDQNVVMNREVSRKIFARFERPSGFVVTFWLCAGLLTEIREAAENFGEEIFSNALGQALYLNYLTLRKIRNFLGGSRVQKLFARPYAYRHVVATLHGCRSDLLDDKLLLNTTLRSIRNANMQLAKTKTENPLVYRVSDDIMGGGVSVNALITTSHLTIHTSRLHQTVEFDCATCGCDSNPWAALETFKRALKPTHVTMQYEHDELQQRMLTVPPIKT